MSLIIKGLLLGCGQIRWRLHWLTRDLGCQSEHFKSERCDGGLAFIERGSEPRIIDLEQHLTLFDSIALFNKNGA